MYPETQSPTNNGIEKVVNKSEITLDSITTAKYQKEGTLTAQIRQIIATKSKYPSKKVNSNMQDNLFSTEEFGFETKDYDNSETRVAWILVPTNATDAIVNERLAKAMASGAVIYRVMSNSPILTDDQLYSIEVGNRTMDDFADAQVVRFPKGHPQEGQISLDLQGKVQYRQCFFSAVPKEDMDLRNGKSNEYKSIAISAELEGASVVTGQTVF